MNIIDRGESVYLILNNTEHEITDTYTLSEELRKARSNAMFARDTRRRRERQAELVARFRATYPDAVPVKDLPNAWWSPSVMEGISDGDRLFAGQIRKDAIPPQRVVNYGGRISHVWTGGYYAVCGAELNSFKGSTKPFGKCMCAKVTP